MDATDSEAISEALTAMGCFFVHMPEAAQAAQNVFQRDEGAFSAALRSAIPGNFVELEGRRFLNITSDLIEAAPADMNPSLFESLQCFSEACATTANDVSDSLERRMRQMAPGPLQNSAFGIADMHPAGPGTTGPACP